MNETLCKEKLFDFKLYREDTREWVEESLDSCIQEHFSNYEKGREMIEKLLNKHYTVKLGDNFNIRFWNPEHREIFIKGMKLMGRDEELKKYDEKWWKSWKKN